MRKIYLVLPAVLLLAAGCSSPAVNSDYTPNGANSVPAAASPEAGPAVNARVKLADQPDYQYYYLISGSSLTPEAKTALTGFAMAKQSLPDGTTQIDLSSTNPEYKNQQYVLKPGEELYFKESFLGDDKEDKELGLRDDAAVVVDSQGYIVQ